MAEDGGPAFPAPAQVGPIVSKQNGMSLRDWMAGQVLAGFCTTRSAWSHITASDAALFARASYVLADAMLAERRKPAAPEATDG